MFLLLTIASLVAPPVALCPNNCSNHGTCDTSSLTCNCAQNWAGTTCAYAITPLEQKKDVHGTIVKTSHDAQVSWNYWRTTISNGDSLFATVTPTNCTLNLYALYGTAPSIANYGAAISASNAQTLRYDAPSLGNWYFGVAATSNCSYTLRIEAHSTCPNGCSGHGTCNTGTGACSCAQNYTSLPDCSLGVFSLESGSTNGNTVPSGWKYYKFTASGNDMLVNFTLAPGGGQQLNEGEVRADLAADATSGVYVRALSLPTLYDYDQACNSVSAGTTCSLQFLHPQGGIWYIGVWSTGTAPVSFTILLSTTMSCPNHCSRFGTCGPNGICACPNYYSNPDCSLYSRSLTANTGPSAPILISREQTQYFTYSSSGHSNDLSFSINQTTTSDALHLVILAGCGIIPSPLNFNDYVWCSRSSSLCMMTLLRAPACDWTFAVLATGAPAPQPSPPQPLPTAQQPTSTPVPSQAPITSVPSQTPPQSSENGEIRNGALKNIFEAENKGENNLIFTNGGLISSLEGDFKRNSAADGPVQVQYTMELSAAVLCPNGCSGNGECQADGKCLCHANYNHQIDCSIFVKDVVNSTGYFSSISAGEWKYYRLVAHMDTYISFTISNLIGAPIEAYLYNEGLPTRFKYLKTIAPGNQTMYQLSATANTAPINGTWTLGIYGIPPPSSQMEHVISHSSSFSSNSFFSTSNMSLHRSSGGDNSKNGSFVFSVLGHESDSSPQTTFVITAVADRACPAGCSLNGYCTSIGTCICNPGYVRSDCSALSVALPANLEVQGMVRFDTWSYYNLTVLGDDALEVWVQENDNLIYGLVWMFVAKGRLPSIEDHDYSNQTDSVIHSIFIPSGETRGLWMVGVTGSPRATGSSYGRTAKYNLFATSGCATYATCDTCVLDPNCGWCRNQPFDPAAGHCVPGNDQTSLNQTCLYYQYSSCSMKSAFNTSLMKGLIIGVGVGLFILIAAAVTAFLLYRYYRHWEKSEMRPANIYAHDDLPTSPGLASQFSSRHMASFGGASQSNVINSEQGAASGSDSQSSAASRAASLVNSAILSDDINPNPTPDDAAVPLLDDENTVSPALKGSSSSVPQRPPPSNVGYGSMLDPEAAKPSQAPSTEGVYYSFSRNDIYTDSEIDTGAFSSDSEAEY